MHQQPAGKRQAKSSESSYPAIHLAARPNSRYQNLFSGSVYENTILQVPTRLLLSGGSLLTIGPEFPIGSCSITLIWSANLWRETRATVLTVPRPIRRWRSWVAQIKFLPKFVPATIRSQSLRACRNLAYARTDAQILRTALFSGDCRHPKNRPNRSEPASRRQPAKQSTISSRRTRV